MIEVSPGTWISEPEVIVVRDLMEGEADDEHVWAVTMPSGAQHFLTDDEYARLTHMSWLRRILKWLEWSR